jgi:hypothetical protein
VFKIKDFLKEGSRWSSEAPSMCILQMEKVFCKALHRLRMDIEDLWYEE